ncbi:MAG: OmpA family protein, partial [Alphaproteobacteria bacterium]|nr:OmpA family protein [Alphaproteobacteria bacterium]
LLALSSPASAGRFTAWYFGVDGGASWAEDLDVSVYGTPLPLPVGSSGIDFDMGWAAFVSGGYSFDNNWRVELEGGYRHNDIDTVTPPALPAVSLTGDVAQYTLMANVLYDFASSSGAMLSIGAGVGADYSRARTAAIAPLLTPFDGDDVSLAFQALVGASYPLTSWMDLTLNYRYLYVTDVKLSDENSITPAVAHVDSNGGAQDHTVTMGLRFGGRAPDRPVAVAKAAPPPPPPPPPAARQYVVYFGFNKCSITAEADNVLSEAAAATRQLGSVTVKIVGHTDTVGSKGANQILSECRAESAKSNLIAKGVPGNTIYASGRGETQLFVDTANGVKEPQNRRATVDLN